MFVTELIQRVQFKTFCIPLDFFIEPNQKGKKNKLLTHLIEQITLSNENNKEF